MDERARSRHEPFAQGPQPLSSSPLAPDTQAPRADHPAWSIGASPRSAILRGLRIIGAAPGIVLFSTALGFGAMARALGFSLGHVMFLSASVYALPAQLLLIDQLARGATLAAVAMAVSLTAIRLLPMTVAMMPYLRDGRGTRAIHILAVHFIAVTAWIEGSRRLPPLPEPLRLPYFLGIGAGTVFCTVMGSMTGYLVAGALPPTLAAALLFMTPIYFLLSMMLGARDLGDWLAVLFGAILGPSLYLLIPGPDLLLTGLLGGTLAWAIGRWRRS
jgi:predicted branched-subunit amino acid permease